MKHKLNKWHLLLLFLSALAALKMIFFAFGLDEEYQLVMSYRNARGDRLFLDMWEPHQSSAFLCTIIMKPWLALFGTTGIVLWLRLCGTLIHLGVSIYLYRTLRSILAQKEAWLLALIYFNTIPKQIILPEFGIMQVWFYTLFSLFLLRYYAPDTQAKGSFPLPAAQPACPVGGKLPHTFPRKNRRRYLILAALALVLNILSYPSCLILFPFALFLLIRLSGKTGWQDVGLFTLICVLCGAGYLAMLFTYTSPSELITTLSHILTGDVTHSLTLHDKLAALLRDALYLAALWAGCLALSAGICKWRNLRREMFFSLAAMLSCGVEVFYWVILRQGYEMMQIHLIGFALAGLWACSKKNVKESALQKITLLRCLMLGALLSLLAVVYLTDLNLATSVPHAMPAAFFGAVLLLFACRRTDAPPSGHKWVMAALTVWCLTAIFGKGYSLRSGVGYNNVLQSGGILKKGPAAGTISTYMGAYIYNQNYEDWQTLLQDGDRVLIMVDQVMSLGTIQYLFKDVEISHFSIVNPTAYDERLLEYWELYPEKSPNVIIVDCWYGDLMAEPDSWMMRYIEEDFGYTQAEDGSYIRIYRRDNSADLQ